MEEGQQCFHPNGQTVISWPNKVDLSHLCRICANSSEYLISIFDGEGTENDLEFKIKKHLPIKISKEEPLPLSLCYQCASTLIAWHDLTLGCIEADKRLRALSQGSCKEESSAQFKVDDNDDNNESFRGASDCEIELEEEVTTTPSTSTQVEIDNLSTSIKVKKKIVNKSTLIKQESEKKQKQVKEDETKENASLIESTSSERCPITSKVIHKAQILDSKTSVTADCSKTLDNKNICDKHLKKIESIKNNAHTTTTIEKSSSVKKKITIIYPCKYCGESFKFRSQYKMHMLDHKKTSTIRFRNEAEDIFKVELEMKEGVLYLCEQCGKSFKLKQNYILHQKKHKEQKPYACHVCGRRFLRCSGLSLHLKYIHLGIKDHVCNICGRSFGLKTSLESHRTSHTGERPFICHFCGKTFKTKSTMNYHCQTHTDNFPYQCPYCQHRFRKKARLFDHLTSHTGEKKHACDVCGKLFGVKNDLVRHKKTHTDTKPFKCQMCTSCFAQKRYLKNHMRVSHKIVKLNEEVN